jgi:MtN3 and saliva related transmembrane protein
VTAAALVNGVGTAAGLCSMASFVPQLVKIARERSAEGVSLRTYMVTVTGFVLWIAYGVLLGSWPVAVSNAVSLLLSGAILALKWRYGDGAPAAPPKPEGARPAS